ncbi:MAG TPA: class I SAM-dependent methyltransferase [Thermoanaerobaculia bacterium]
MAEPDQYARVHYRHLIAWPERIRREAPLLERVLGSGPTRRVLDLGSGPGDHARFLASVGFDVVGVDASESMLKMATEEAVPENVRFIQGDFRELPALVDGTFGGAICLGNVLPHLTEEEDVRAIARGLAAKLERGGRFLVQMLNYQRMVAQNERALPVNFRSDPEGGPGEIAFVRMMTLPDAERRVQFYPTTLRIDAGAEEPVTVLASKRVDLRAWSREDIVRIFGGAGIEESEALGGFDGTIFEPERSRDLIWIGRKAS